MTQHFENSKKNEQFFLLPAGYKLPGYLILLVGIIGLAWKKIASIGLVFAGNLGKPEKPDAVKIMLYIIVVLGLILIAWTREKVEDELIVHMRLKAMGMAFILGIVYVVTIPFIDLLGGHIPAVLTSTQLIIGMLLIYLVSFSIQKKRS